MVPQLDRPAGHPRLTNWLAGLVVGASGGLLVLVVPPFGALLIALWAMAVVGSRPCLAGASGLLVGVEATVMLLLVRAAVACEAFDAVANQGCESPDLTAFVALGGGFLVVGLIGSMVSFARGLRV